MIKLTPFKFKHVSFFDGVRQSLLSLQLDETLIFEEHGVVLISGDSGSGKSTLLNIIKGLIPFQMLGEFDGEVWIDDVKLSKENVESFNNKIVYLFQNPFSQLIHHDSSLEMAFTLENLNFPADQFEQTKNKIIKKLGLEDRLNVPTNLLSTGECQKLVLGSLIAISPKILLLDEPTAFLDPKARENFYTILSELKHNHLIILVDHHVEEVSHLVDQWIMIKDKKVIKTNHSSINELKISEKINLNFKPMTDTIEYKINQLSFSYNPNRKLLDHINLKAKGSECIVITGENGQGKSTLFKLMSGIISVPNSIELNINNRKIKHKEILNYSGFVFQNPENNFFYNSLREEVPGSENRELLSMFFTENEFDRSPFLFSEGQKRRISFIINLALKKKILFLDEPTFGQDKKNKIIIAEIINALKKMGLLLFVISHDEAFINAVGDRVYQLENGNLNEVK